MLDTLSFLVICAKTLFKEKEVDRLNKKEK